MPARRTDWDIKLFNANLSPNERRVKLVTTSDAAGNLRKLWKVNEAPPSNINADFAMSDWSWGAGLERLSASPSGPGDVFRYADGYGIDTTDPRFVRQGPGATTIGAVTGTPVRILLGPDNRVWIITNSHFYAWNGTTLENFYGDAGSTHGASSITTFTDAVIYGNSLVVSYGTGYKHTDGSAAPTDETPDVDYIVTINETLWASYSTNLVRAITDPLGTPAEGTDITVGSGEAITNLFKLSGLLCVATESSIFVVNTDNTVTELNDELRERAGAQAFSVKAGKGTDIWLADTTPELIRIAAVGFDEFDVTFPGPFSRGQEERPFTQIDVAGNITGLAKDLDFVYAAADRNGDLYVYKGAEPVRGRYVWSPFIRRTTASNNVIGVAKMTGDSHPILYLDDGGTIFAYDTRDWTVYNTDAQLLTPYFGGNDETLVKTWTRLKALYEGDGIADATIQAEQRSGTISTFTVIGAPQGNGSHSLNPGIISNPRVQLRFTWASTDNTKHLDIRSFTLEGLVRPELRRIWDFTVYVDNKAESDWYYDMREQGAAFTLITDRFGTQRSMYVLPGYPEEQIIFDEILKAPVMAYRIVAQGLPQDS